MSCLKNYHTSKEVIHAANRRVSIDNPDFSAHEQDVASHMQHKNGVRHG
jgi:hypothetical protein